MQTMYAVHKPNGMTFNNQLCAGLAGAFFFLGLWVSTQYIIRQAHIPGTHPFFACLIWAIHPLHPVHDQIITRGIQIGTLVTGVLIVLVFLLYWKLQRKFDETGIHGSSEWATRRMIEKANLLDQKDGIYIGKWAAPGSRKSFMLRDNTDSHAIVIAPTGTGKGLGIVLPNLLSWKGSVIVYDIKGENYAFSAGYRKTELGQRIFSFNPVDASGKNARYNPLAEIRKGIHEIRDVQAVVDMLIDPDGKGKSSHWDKSAENLLIGVILHSLYVGKNPSLEGALNLLSNPHMSVEDLLKLMKTAHHDLTGECGWIDPHTQQKTKTHPRVASIAQEMSEKCHEELSGVVSTALTYLSLYRDPIVCKNTSESDFSLRTLMKGETPTSLYLIIPPSDRQRLKPLVRLLINQLCVELMENADSEDFRNLNDHKYSMLLLLDEFTSLGRMDNLKDSLAYMRGYGIRSLFICQDLNSLNDVYGNDNPVLGHCKTQIFFSANSVSTATYMSKLFGETTVVKHSKSFSSANIQNISESVTESRRPLLTLDEATDLPVDVEVIFSKGLKIYAKKISVLDNAEFNRRRKIPPPQLCPRPKVSEMCLDRMDNVVQKPETAQNIDTDSIMSGFYNKKMRAMKLK